VDNQSSPILLWPNYSWKLSNFAGSYLALKKGSIAHFSVFLANWLKQISLYNPKGAISALLEFLRRKCDDKYTHGR
jgi:hypothetical protein